MSSGREGGWPCCSREPLFELQRRVIRQSILFDSASSVSWSSS